MSSSLIWKPIVPDEGESLSCAIKFALRKKYDGNIDAKLGHDDVSYLRGLEDAGIEDAKDLIDAILEHDEVHVKEVW